jgi:hypothetical protein
MAGEMAEWLFVTFTDGHLRTAVCVGLARVALSQSHNGIGSMHPRILTSIPQRCHRSQLRPVTHEARGRLPEQQC